LAADSVLDFVVVLVFVSSGKTGVEGSELVGVGVCVGIFGAGVTVVGIPGAALLVVPGSGVVVAGVAGLIATATTFGFGLDLVSAA
jgi:hypothetical protein